MVHVTHLQDLLLMSIMKSRTVRRANSDVPFPVSVPSSSAPSGPTASSEHQDQHVGRQDPVCSGHFPSPTPSLCPTASSATRIYQSSIPHSNRSQSSGWKTSPTSRRHSHRVRGLRVSTGPETGSTLDLKGLCLCAFRSESQRPQRPPARIPCGHQQGASPEQVHPSG